MRRRVPFADAGFVRSRAPAVAGAFGLGRADAMLGAFHRCQFRWRPASLQKWFFAEWSCLIHQPFVPLIITNSLLLVQPQPEGDCWTLREAFFVVAGRTGLRFVKCPCQLAISSIRLELLRKLAKD